MQPGTYGRGVLSLLIAALLLNVIIKQHCRLLAVVVDIVIGACVWICVLTYVCISVLGGVSLCMAVKGTTSFLRTIWAYISTAIVLQFFLLLPVAIQALRSYDQFCRCRRYDCLAAATFSDYFARVSFCVSRTPPTTRALPINRDSSSPPLLQLQSFALFRSPMPIPTYTMVVGSHSKLTV